MDKVTLRFKKLDEKAVIPQYQTEDAAGFDLHAVVDGVHQVGKLEKCIVTTGLAVEIPSGYEMQIRPRSGMAFKSGITIINSPGTVDSDYRGEIKVALFNLGEKTFSIRNGDRIAQGVICKLPVVYIEESDGDLSDTARGTGGYGSTGV